MEKTIVPCPIDASLVAFLEGKLPEKELELIDAHASECRKCQSRLEELCDSEAMQFPEQTDDTFSESPNLHDLHKRLAGDSSPVSYRQLSEVQAPQADGHIVHELIGRGGMGAVYRATETTLQRDVAFKILNRMGSNPDEANTRFAREAELTACLDHPSIIPIHRYGHDQLGRSFYTMRLVHGQDLRTMLKDSIHLDRSRVLGLLVRVCQAVAFAHDRRIIHRDLKPANIMVGDLGEVYVLDWGLARRVTDEPGKAASQCEETLETTTPSLNANAVGHSNSDTKVGDSETQLTQAGSALGTPAYMSPEQALGDLGKVDELSDVYSLGAILFHILTGHTPYSESESNLSPHQILRRVIQNQPVTTDDLYANNPPELIAICEKAIARDREERYESARAMADDVQAFLDQRVVRAYRTGALVEARKWVSRNRIAATAAALAMLLGTVGLVTNAMLQSKANRELQEANEETSSALLREQNTTDELRETTKKLEVANQETRVALEKEETAKLEARQAAKSEKKAKLEAFAMLADSYANYGQIEAEKNRLDRYPRAAEWFLKAAELTAGNPRFQKIHQMQATQFFNASPTPVDVWDDREGTPRDTWLGCNLFHGHPTGKYFLQRSYWWKGYTIFELKESKIELWSETVFHGAAFSPDGESVAVCLDQGRIEIRRLDDNRVVQTVLPGQPTKNPVFVVSFSPSGRLLHIGKKSARIWDVQRSRFLPGTYLCDPRPQYQQSGFSEDESQFAVLQNGNESAYIFDVMDKEGEYEPIKTPVNDELMNRFKFKKSMLGSTEWPDGEPVERSNQIPFGSHGDGAIAVATEHDGRHLVVGHSVGNFRRWRIKNPLPYCFVREKAVVRPRFSPDGSVVFPVGHYYVGNPRRPSEFEREQLLATRAWWPATGEPASPECHAGVPIVDGQVSPDGKILALACGVLPRTNKTIMEPDGKAGSLQFWDWKAGKQIGESVSMPSEPLAIDWHPDQSVVVATCAAGQVVVVNVDNRKTRLFHDSGLEHAVGQYGPGAFGDCGVKFSDNGKMVLWWGYKGKGTVFSYPRGNVRSSFSGDGWCMDMKVHGAQIAVSRMYTAPRSGIFSPNGKTIRRFGHGGSLHFNHSSELLLCVDKDINRVIRTRDGRVVSQFGKEGSNTFPFQDGRFIGQIPYVITVGESIQIFDYIKGQIAAPPLTIPMASRTRYVEVDPKGHFAAMMCWPYGLLIYDLRSLHEPPMLGLSQEDFAALLRQKSLVRSDNALMLDAGLRSRFAIGQTKTVLDDRLQEILSAEIPNELLIRDHRTRAHQLEVEGNKDGADFHRRKADELSAPISEDATATEA